MNLNSVVTITLGDMAENHAGMEQIGQMVQPGQGFNIQDLEEIKERFDGLGIETELINLSDHELNGINPTNTNLSGTSAHILVIRNGVDAILSIESNFNKEQMMAEQISLNVDKHAFMYGRVVNKKARWNLCFSQEASEPDYENKKGRVIRWDDVPITKVIYDNIVTYFGEKAHGLEGEGNYYYDITQCGIGYHGDSERRKVIGIRLGSNMPLYYQWFNQGEAVGNRIQVNLNCGDIYIMSEKTVGTDWKKKTIYTLRHATGTDKFINI